MMKYIMIVCNANFDTMMTTQSNLTWFEEWMLFFEMMWGKTHTRVKDLVDMYRVESFKHYYAIIEHKLDLVLCCQHMLLLKKINCCKRKNGMKSMVRQGQ